jgi:hypothetical protein
LINELIADFELLRKNLLTMTQEEIMELEEEERHSREYLGHKPIEVFFGILSGILIAFVLHALFFG